MTDTRQRPQDRTDRSQLRELWTRVQKILAQEGKTGYGDCAVIGGLERFVSTWAASVSSHQAAYYTWQECRRVVALLQDYSALGVDDREKAVRGSWRVAAEVLERMSALSGGTSVSGPTGDEAPAGQVVSPPPRPSSGERTRDISGSSSAPKTPSASEGRKARTQAPARVRISQRTRLQDSSLSLDDPVLVLKGVGKSRASLLSRLGIVRLRDLLLHFPRDYRDYQTVRRVAELMYGETASVVGVVDDVQVMPGPRQRVRTTARVRDETGVLSATWFRYGYGGIKVVPGSRIAVAGTVSGFGSHLVLDGPDWESADAEPLHTRRLVPVYPLTEGVSDYWLRELESAIVPVYAPRLEDQLPGWVVSEYGLMPLREAVEKVHFPGTREESEEGRRRLAFDELFILQLAALKRRAEWRSGASSPALSADGPAVESFISAQPYSLTAAQRRVIGEIAQDLADTRPMTRLLQGEVGSGKTIVAAVALLSAVLNGYQGALMAPTEILAEQHGRSLESIFGNAAPTLTQILGRTPRIEVLTSASKRAEREKVYREAADGEVDIVVGTQALIQESLGFSRLGLAVVDEQHRFGVAQRTALREKGGTPHLLVMTATPIPRTLALTLYGDLDLSVIDELPPGRQKVLTHLLGPNERHHAYEHIHREVALGRQAFIICPLVEDSPNLEVRAATAEYERLKNEELGDLRLTLLHGRMRPSEKDRIMLEFRQGLHDVLVSTSVVEVGIDIPNATVIVIEGADRFGLAQLHQFRGRVGRGSHRSTCILLSDVQDEASLERLRTVASVSDGFRLAEEDLKLRGPGEYFGVRQSGFAAFRVADLGDVSFVEKARKAAARLLELDPTLAKPEHRALAARVEELQRAGNS